MWISLFLFHFCLNFNAKLVDHELSLGQYIITIDNFTSGSSLHVHVHVFVISHMQLCYMIRIQIFLNLTKAANNFFLVKVLLIHHLSRANKLQSEIIKNVRFTQGRFLFILSLMIVRTSCPTTVGILLEASKNVGWLMSDDQLLVALPYCCFPSVFFLKDWHKIPLDDLESKLGTDFKKVRQIHYSIVLSRLLTISNCEI